MAPVTSSATGVAGQIIDDPELSSLISRLSSLCHPAAAAAGTADGADDDHGDLVARKIVTDDETVAELVEELARYPKWRFQEQVSWGWVELEWKPNQAWSSDLSVPCGRKFWPHGIALCYIYTKQW
jgi:hypothetical protein